MSLPSMANIPSSNPASFNAPMSASNPAGYAFGVYGTLSTLWTISNYSTISADGAVGIGLSASGTLTNWINGLISANYIGLRSQNTSTILNLGAIVASGLTITDGIAVILPSFHLPSGLPTGTLSLGDGVRLLGPASSIVNEGVIGGAEFGVRAIGSADSVTNSGLITASETRINEAGLPSTIAIGVGVDVTNGSVTNESGQDIGLLTGVAGDALGTIVGALVGVLATGTLGPATISNAGTIAGTAPTSVGVLLNAGGVVDNQTGGTISGGAGVGIAGGSGVVINENVISAWDSTQRAFPFADAFTIGTGAFLQSAAPDQLGMLRAAGAGVGMLSGGSVSNGAGGTISGVAVGVYLAGAPLTLTNAGSITATDPEGIGVFLQGDGSASNFGDITAPIFGVVTGNGPGHVLNAGVIDATGGTLGTTSTNPLLAEAGFGSAPAGTRLGWGVFEDAGGTVTNGSAPSTGWIIGAANGVVVAGGAGTVVNADGTISGGGIGVLLSAGGTVGNAAGQRIEGASAGIVITGNAGGTVSNAGTIAGTGGSGADSVLFSDSGTNLLQIAPGATFAGNVIFAAGATNDLELLSAASTGSLSGLGTRFAGAGQITVDPGAAWDLTGQNTLSGSDVVSLGSLTNRGTLLALAGSGGSVISAGPASFANDGLIENVSGTLTVAALAAGTGRIAIAAGSAMHISGTVGSGQTIDLAGPGAVLALGNAAQFAGTVEAFGGTATIDLANTTLSGAALTASALNLTLASGGTLSLAMAAPVAGASVQVAADGTGGTDVVFGVPGGTPGQGSLDLSAYAPGAEAAAAAALAGLAASGGPLRYDDAAGSFGTAQAGATNIAVLTAPVAGSTLAPPTGFAGLAATGSAALTLGDGGAGHALLIGNQGADTITGSGSGDTLIGGQGANMFVAGAGVDIVTGDGADTVNAPSGADTVTTGAGGSLLFLGGANDMVASNGADTIVGSSVTGQTEFLNAAGAEVFGGNSGTNTVVNSGGQDTVAAGNGPETIFANAGGGLYELNASAGLEFVGNTTGTGTILGGSGQATLFGGSGKYLYVMGGETTEFAIQQGAATMIGGGGNASVWAGTGGPDVFFQNGGSLLYDAQSSQSTVVDASGKLDPTSDVFFAGAGGAINVFNASNGNVFVGYGTGNTTLNGGGASGNNIFFAGSGNTTIFGGHGNDTFVAGTGSAVMVPDYSQNVFEFTKGAAGGTETIWHFSAADQVALFGYGAGAIIGQSSTGGSTTVTLADNTRIVFAGIANLNAAQIHSF